MKTKLTICCLFLMLGGCASSERAKLKNAYDLATITFDTLGTMRDQGNISDENWEEIQKIAPTLNELLEDWYSYTESGIIDTDMSYRVAKLTKKLREYLEGHE